MRHKISRQSVESFMARLGYGLQRSAKVYIVGGGTAVLYGWRNSTVDIDLKIVPETDEILRRLPKLKEQLEINVELASRDDFIEADLYKYRLSTQSRFGILLKLY